MVERIFYVTQGSLRVWAPGSNEYIAEFADDDRGLRSFDHYLGQNAEQSSAMLIDVIEEEFSMDSIPDLRASDRNALIGRRSKRKFRHTPYRLSMLQGKQTSSDEGVSVLHSAIANHELLDPWLQMILQHRVPLSGIHSVPLMAPALFKKLFDSKNSVQFVASHQGSTLRQVFVQQGHLRSARLSKSPSVGDEDYAQFVITETMRSRRYLERVRLLSSMEVMDVVVVAEEETAAKIAAFAAHEEATRYHFVDPQIAAQKSGMTKISTAGHFEEVYLSIIGVHQPKHSYARGGEDRYWHMQRLRNALVAGTVAIAAVCSVLAAVLLTDTWTLRHRIAANKSQLEQLTETFRRENEKFDPIRADSYEMKLAVDTGDFILHNRIPVPWVMNQLGVVLGNYPDIQLRELRWSAATPAPANTTRTRRDDVPVMVSVSTLNAVSAVLTADIVPFDGDMRAAFARIDALTADLQEKTDFSQAMTVAYPFDASTSAALSGEITAARSSESTRFKVRVIYELQPTDVKIEKYSNDSI